MSTSTREAYAKIYAVIRRIPPGKVATYGQIAALAGLPGRARQVGASLRDLPDGSNVPWQRVINAQGTISARPGRLGVAEGYQRHLLEEEGVELDERGKIDFGRFGWDPERVPAPKPSLPRPLSPTTPHTLPGREGRKQKRSGSLLSQGGGRRGGRGGSGR